MDGSLVKANSTVTTELSAVPPNNDDCADEKIKDFLKSINMEIIFQYLKAAQITYQSLQYLKENDLKEAIPPLGLRVEFREKLFAWKKSELGIDDATLSMPSKVEQWLNHNDDSTMTQSCSNSGNIISKDLKLLLSKSINHAIKKIITRL